MNGEAAFLLPVIIMAPARRCDQTAIVALRAFISYESFSGPKEAGRARVYVKFRTRGEGLGFSIYRLQIDRIALFSTGAFTSSLLRVSNQSHCRSGSIA